MFSKWSNWTIMYLVAFKNASLQHEGKKGIWHNLSGISVITISTAAENMAQGTGWVLKGELSWNSIQHNEITTNETRHETICRLLRHWVCNKAKKKIKKSHTVSKFAILYETKQKQTHNLSISIGMTPFAASQKALFCTHVSRREKRWH